MNKNIIFTLVLTVISCCSYGQLTVTSGTLTPQQYVENVLIGPGVTVSNVQFNNNLSYSGNQIGQFNYVGNQIPFAYGLILASGGVAGAIGPNNSGSSTVPVTIPTLSNDAQLNSVSGFATNDVGKLEFNFVPAGNTVSFNFLFGSEEYNEYVCGSVNDVFGFFVSGPNPLGGNYINTNLALVPSTIGTTNIPISINTVNNGSVGSAGSATNCLMLDPNWTANNVYFSGAPGTNFQADGMTELINIQFNVVCGEVYQFKFAVADGGDAAFDSWVFLQSGSFSSDVVDVAVATVSGDTTIIEGCNFADIVFTRPEVNMLDTLSIIYTIGGTATEGVDYANLMDTIIFLPGVDTVIVNLTPLQDNIIEGYESVIISVNIINPCGDTIVSSGTVYVWDGPIIDSLWSTIAVCGPTGSVHVDVVAPSVPATYLWNSPNALTFSGPDWQNIIPGWYYITLTQAQCSVSDSVEVLASDTLTISSVSSTNANCEPTGSVHVEILQNMAQVTYSWTNLVVPISTWNQQDWQYLDTGWYHITVTQGGCTDSDSVEVLLTPNPEANLNIVVPLIHYCSPEDILFTNTSQNASSFVWNFSNGQLPINDSTTTSITQTFIGSSIDTIQLIASEGACADTANIYVTIDICGCDNDAAINYDPLVTYNDGSCIYPFPEVFAPNVFTPNSDAENPTYFLSGKNLVSLELTILNRWGAVVFSKSSSDLINNNPAWDGKINGDLATDGIYFYIYKATGITNQIVEGHGFLHLISDK